MSERILALISIIYNQYRFDQMNKRFDEMNKRFDEMKSHSDQTIILIKQLLDNQNRN